MFMVFMLILFTGLLSSSNSLEVMSLLIFLEMILYVSMYTLSWFHIMILLMLLELIMLNIFLMTVIVSWKSSMSYFVIYTFITLSVAEASVGMSLLTMLIRAHGNDFLSIGLSE